MTYNIVAGIVLYNPEIHRLEENIKAVINQVDYLFVADNGSSNKAYMDIVAKFDKITILRNETNKGIAFALNQIMFQARKLGAKWVLTLDQDSVVEPNMVSVYCECTKDNVGIITCDIVDRNFKLSNNNKYLDEEDLNWCITSASFTNVEAWYKAGGFDNKMFIDWVDTDICWSMKAHGYRIIKTYKTHLKHELGTNTRIIKIGGSEHYILNRPSFRYYYVVRNLIYLSKKHKTCSLRSQLIQVLWTYYIVLRYETNKWNNFCAMNKGLVDSLPMKVVRNYLDNPNIYDTFI